MGLLRMAARTAVVAGTATAVSGRVHRRQAAKWDQQDAEQYAQEQQSRSSRSTRLRRKMTRPRSSRTWRSCTRRACSPMRSSRPPRPRRSESDPSTRGHVTHVEAYSRLAAVYDEIVVDPCHGHWASFLDDLWSADPAGVRSVLDLCCGTGLLAGELIARGYRVVGVDASDAMLALARERLGPEAALSRITLPDLAVEGVFDAAVCTFDGLNYLSPDDLRLTVDAVAGCVRPAGWLVFDLHTDAMMSFTIANPDGRRSVGGKRLRDQQCRRLRRPHLRHQDRDDVAPRG